MARVWSPWKRPARRLVLGSGLLLLMVTYLWQMTEVKTSLNEPFSMRHLLAVTSMVRNCTPRAVQQFPHDALSAHVRTHGGLVLHVIGVLYMFLALAIVCDDYFVPSLEKLSDRLGLSEDVAGATLMAAGSSAPELATTLIAVFIAKDDIGVGAVVGSAIFNVLLVPSVCALGAGAVLSLHWWPVFRDCLVYALSIVVLALVIYDGKVTWYESLALVLLYVLYVGLMACNQRIARFVDRLCAERCKPGAARDVRSGAVKYTALSTCDLSSDSQSEEVSILDRSDGLLNVGKETEAIQQEPSKEKTTERRSPLSKLWHLFKFPITLLLTLTVPDCQREGCWSRLYFFTFLISIVWISVFSYLMIWFITIIGFTLGIPDTVMGLSLLAAGTSIPDAITSLIVVRNGQGDMAIANAVGSNIFDILLCLGLPWLLQTLIVAPTSTVPVYSQGLVYSSLTLLITVLLLLLVTWCHQWQLTMRYGWITLFLYLGLTAFCLLYELNVFGQMHLPECSIEY